jgi:hypothetical protein
LKSQEAREDEAVEKSEEEKKGGKRRRKTHPSSTVSSAAKSTKSNPSKTFLLSTWPLNNNDTASWNAVNVWDNMTSFEVESGPTIMNVKSVVVRVKMICGGRGWISPIC